LVDQLVGIGCRRDWIHVVPNGADVTAFDPRDDGRSIRDELGLSGATVIGFVGSLKAWHGVDVLLDAFARVHSDRRETRLLLVGTGPTESELRRRVHDLGVDDVVVFTGAVDHVHVPRMLAAMDITVAPFKGIDDFHFSPIKLYEYMAAGRCIVASRLGQIAKVVDHDRNGLLCAPDDPAALASVLGRAVDDEPLRRRLCDSARDEAVRYHTWDRTAERVEQVLNDVIGRCRVGAEVSRPVSQDAFMVSRGLT